MFIDIKLEGLPTIINTDAINVIVQKGDAYILFLRGGISYRLTNVEYVYLENKLKSLDLMRR